MIKNILCYTLVAIGFLQMIGFVFKQDWLKGVGLMTTASPLPIVFTEVKGIETFAQDFYLFYDDKYGIAQEVKITPKLYGKFDAPYNYRNVVGAAVSYGPVLPEEIWKSVLKFSFITPGILTHAIGLEKPITNVGIRVKTRTAGKSNEWILNLD